MRASRVPPSLIFLSTNHTNHTTVPVLVGSRSGRLSQARRTTDFTDYTDGGRREPVKSVVQFSTAWPQRSLGSLELLEWFVDQTKMGRRWSAGPF